MANQFHKSWGARPFTVTRSDGRVLRIEVKGRARWALERLIEAGRRGCSTVDDPAPRWAAYIHKLRSAGLEIETVNEAHHGPFEGTHARYVLRCLALPVPAGEAA